MTMLSTTDRRQLDELGYLVLPDFVPAPMLEAMRERVEALWSEEGDDAGSEFRLEPGTRRLANLVDKGDVFARMIVMPGILECIEAVIGPDYKLSSLNARSTNPHNPEAQPWHEELYVYRAYLRRVAGRLKGWLGEPGQRQAGEDRAGWDANVAALQAIADIARREQLPLEVALLPHTWSFERERALFARVNDVCRGQQLACVDLRAAFAARRLDEASLRLNLLDAHPNENYNAAVAEELAPRLARLVEAIESRRGLQPVRLE